MSEDPAVAEWRQTLDIKVHDAAQKHLVACYEAMYEAEDGNTEVEDPSFAPFCGCETCVVREVLTAAWMHIRWGEETPETVRRQLQREWD